MAKRKKQSVWLKNQGFGTKNLAQELRRAELQIVKKDWDAAIQILVPLSQQYPQEKNVWELLVMVSSENQNQALYQKACEGLFAAAPSGDVAYALGSAYIQNMHPLLALKTFRRALEMDPHHPFAADATQVIQNLEPKLQGLLAEMGLSDEDGLEIAILHEQGQAYLEQRDYKAARQAENQVLERHPEFLSAQNNLSLIHWMEGDSEGAIATARAVLEKQPDNIHALSNLIRFLCMTGDIEAASAYREPIKASNAAAWDGWTKKVEGLTYLADDASVVEMWEAAQEANSDQEIHANPLFHHLVAVALARTGNTQKAIAEWQKTLRREPGFSLAQENLNNIRLPIALRHGAWPFHLDNWLSPSISLDLRQTLDRQLGSRQEGKLIPALRDFLQRHPELMTILPRLLERGGPQGQEFALGLTEQLKTPELLNLVKDFALGQNGPDQMRYRAAILAAEAKLISKDKVTLWLQGEWREIILLAYQFREEPLVKHAKAVSELLQPALRLLHENTPTAAAEAEALLNQALELEPEAPDLLNNLSIALQQQGQLDACRALLGDIVTRFPDDVFASASLAKLHLLDENIEAAEALLQPFLSRDQFHFMEFSAFSDAYLELLLAKKLKEGAQGWLEIWEKVMTQADLSDPKLDIWKKRLGRSGSKFPKLFK